MVSNYPADGADRRSLTSESTVMLRICVSPFWFCGGKRVSNGISIEHIEADRGTKGYVRRLQSRRVTMG